MMFYKYLALISTLALAFGLLLLMYIKADAHDAARPDLDSWYSGLHSPGHGPCCDGQEATHVADIDWKSDNGHYKVKLEGEWVDVPDDAVVTSPNLDGRALVWAVKTPMGKWFIRCFLPGAGA